MGCVQYSILKIIQYSKRRHKVASFSLFFIVFYFVSVKPLGVNKENNVKRNVANRNKKKSLKQDN